MVEPILIQLLAVLFGLVALFSPLVGYITAAIFWTNGFQNIGVILAIVATVSWFLAILIGE